MSRKYTKTTGVRRYDDCGVGGDLSAVIAADAGIQREHLGLRSWLVVTCLFLLALSGAQGGVIYVHHAATGANNGSSWADAFSGELGVQNALAAAQSGDDIWVAQGTYKPTSGTDRNIWFVMKAGVELYGGFLGNETDQEQRDWEIRQTILSGEIGFADQIADNSYHVVYGSGASGHLL
ncbi:MAG: hypothetical protein HQL31_07680, partial [Planctomycetes bacterium]|nr:hypothetical protein [Planctomycetota bacterium]